MENLGLCICITVTAKTERPIPWHEVIDHNLTVYRSANSGLYLERYN